MTEKLKAYEVREPDEGHCEIVFAEKSVVARREGANELGCEFEEVESCTRAPWADQYAPGPVPLHATLAHGWWHSCSGCGCEFDAKGMRGNEFEEDKPRPAIDPLQDSEHSNYCRVGCMMADWQKRQEIKAREAAAIDYCLTRWPQATRVWPYRRKCGTGFGPNACSMAMPGLQNNVDWILGEGTVSVAQIDVPEFQRLYGTAERDAQAAKLGVC